MLQKIPHIGGDLKSAVCNLHQGDRLTKRSKHSLPLSSNHGEHYPQKFTDALQNNGRAGDKYRLPAV